LAFAARRWWFPPYLFGLFFGFGTGLVIGAWPLWLRDIWWGAWFLIIFLTPAWKMTHPRRRPEPPPPVKPWWEEVDR
jgi:hypothetical protein